jgi:hypothetical protein
MSNPRSALEVAGIDRDRGIVGLRLSYQALILAKAGGRVVRR